MQDFIRSHYQAEVIRWDEFDGDGWLYEVVFQGQLIRADNPSLILRALAEADRREPVGRVIFLPVSPSWPMRDAA